MNRVDLFLQMTRLMDVLAGLVAALGIVFTLTGTWFFGVPMILAAILLWLANTRFRRRHRHPPGADVETREVRL